MDEPCFQWKVTGVLKHVARLYGAGGAAREHVRILFLARRLLDSAPQRSLSGRALLALHSLGGSHRIQVGGAW